MAEKRKLFGSIRTKSDNDSIGSSSNDAAYAELFGDTGITVDEEMNQEEYEDKLFFDALEYCASPERNYLSNIQRGTMSRDSFFMVMKQHFQKEDEDDAVIDRVLTRLEKYIWGYYIIEDLINDDSISDIKILNENQIRIKRHGKRLSTDLKFRNKHDYQRFVDIVCSRNKIMLSDINSIQTFTDTKSNDRARLRFNLTSPFINSNERPVIHIRKILKNKVTLDRLIELEMFPEWLRPYLEMKAATSSGIIFTGKGASGKTTLMNAMIDEIPHDKSGCILQENDELFTDHPDMMSQHIVAHRGESKIQYTLKDLAVNGLLVDLDYFIIGEIKGAEAAYFMNAAYTGHQCWTSVHGMNSQEAMNKLVDYVKYETDYPREDVLRMLRFMNCIIFMKNYKIAEISEIVGLDPKTGELQYKLVYKHGYTKEQFEAALSELNSEHDDKNNVTKNDAITESWVDSIDSEQYYCENSYRIQTSKISKPIRKKRTHRRK